MDPFDGLLPDGDDAFPIVGGRLADHDFVAGQVRVGAHVPTECRVVGDGAAGFHILRRGGSAGAGDEGDGVH